MARLYMIKGPMQGRAFELSDPVTSIGRAPDNNIQIDDPSVSRKHATIILKGDSVFIEDMKSQNGTLINGQAITPFEPHELRQGLSIAMGNIIFILGETTSAQGPATSFAIDLSEQIGDRKVIQPHEQTVITDRKNLELIYEVSSTLLRSLDINEICEKIMHALFLHFSRIDAGYILLLDRETNELKEITARERDRSKHPATNYSRSIVDRVLREGKAVMISDTGLDQGKALSETVVTQRIRSIMCVPLISQAEIRGVVYVHSIHLPQGFQKKDLSLFAALSSPAAVAIENALLYQKTKQDEEALRKARIELEKRVAERTRELLLANKKLTNEITERKRSTAALRESGERYRDLFENTSDLIQNAAPNGRIRYVNRTWKETLGYGEKDLETLSVFDVIAPESKAHCTEALRKVLSGQPSAHVEAVFLTKKGDKVMVDGSFNCRFKEGKPLSTWAILRNITERKKVEEALQISEERFRNMASSAQDALGRAREQEVEIGSRIQQTLLLGTPPRNVPGLGVSAMMIPSQRIDGDFYDFFRQSDQSMDILIGDVMGKGVPAALLGAAVKSHFVKALSDLIPGSKTFPSPAEIVGEVHKRVVEELIDLESFVTLCYVRFDLVNRRGELIDCGHTRTIHLHKVTQGCSTIKGYNMPLGFTEKETYTPLSFPLEAGDVLFFYSDGITEARNAAGEFFGEQRLIECIKAHGLQDSETLIDQVRSDVTAFSGTESFSDDLTCIAVQILTESNLTPVLHLELEMTSDTEQLARLRDFVQDLCQRNIQPPLDMDNTWQLGLAANEAVTNIIRHAYGGRRDGKIHIVAEAFVDRIVLCFNHWGKSFQPPQSVTPPPVEDLHESGYGLFLIQSYVDEVRYSSEPDGKNSIYLVKNRKSA